MNQRSNARLTPNAQTLRRNMTKEERHLWYDFLKSLPVTFNRQKVLGPYIVDFYCGSAGIVIELDGSQHYEVDGCAADKERDRWLKELWITVFRFSNADVNCNFRGVCGEIMKYIDDKG